MAKKPTKRRKKGTFSPMPVLKNPRHERFAQNLAKGMSATEAYKEAGYKSIGHAAEANGARLMRNDKVKARIAELQGSTAKQITDIRDLSRQFTAEAVELQVTIMRDKEAPASVRLAASMALHDRGHGKAVQYIEAEISFYDALGLEDRQHLLAALDALDGDSDEATRH